MRTNQLIAVMALFASCTHTGDVTIRIQDHEGTPFYDAYFVQLKSEGRRIELFGSFDVDVKRSTRVYSSEEFVKKCKEVSASSPESSIKIVVSYDDFGRPSEHLHEISRADLHQLHRGESVDIEIKLPSEHIDSLLPVY